MNSLFRRRPSPAMVVALVALFISLSGVSYGVATGFIDSREIKNNEVRSIDIRNNEVRTRDLRNNEVRGIDIRNSTIRGRDVGLNTLTGDDLNESTLGKVPSATSADTADSATTAGSAGSVGGITFSKISYAGQQTTGFVEVLNLGGLRLEAGCSSDTAPNLEVRATTTVPNSEISASFGATVATSSMDFDPGENLSVAGDNETVQIAYASADGRVVTVDAVGREELNDVRGSTNDCGFFGVAEAG